MKDKLTRNQQNKIKYESQTYFSMDGKPFIVKEYRSHHDVTIKFLNFDFERVTSMNHVLSGKLKSPFYGKGSCPVVFTDPAKEIEETNYYIDGVRYEVLKYNSGQDVIYKCHDWAGYVGHTTIFAARLGQFYNPYKLNIEGSYLGEDLTYRSKEYEFVLHKWHGVCDRCTGRVFLINYTSHKPSIATKKSRMCKQWLCYGEFAKWFVPEFNKLNQNSGIEYHVDKDLLYPIYKPFTGEYKLYSPITCELLPKDINEILFDPSTERNEIFRRRIIKLADKFKKINAISQRAYDAIQLIYNQKYDKSISICGIEQYLEFAPRVDQFNQFY